MRKYEAAALLPDLSFDFNQQVAPASPLFEGACTAFARGTIIPTVSGPIAVEDLLPGDYVQTSEGAQPVTWIGSTTYVPGIDDDATTVCSLSRITCDAFGASRPATDIVVGPAARMVLRRPRLKSLLGEERILVPVSEFADGDRIVTVTPVGPVQLYHFVVPQHATVDLGGIEVETYHPGKAAGEQMGENLRMLFLSLFANIEELEDFGDLCISRSSRDAIEQLALI